jgi:hypothetical protein
MDMPASSQPRSQGPPDLDDIRVFLGAISDEEYAVRSKLRTARNASSWRVSSAESAHARTLLWMCSSTASAWIYAPADVEWLAEVAEYCRSLLALAEKAENLGAG